jgi:hypothetical protein
MQRLLGMAAFGAVACSSGPKGGSDLGYGVVDPMPQPARCAGGASGVHVTAAFEVDPSGKRVLVVRVAPPVDPTLHLAPDPNDPTMHVEGGGLEARVTVADDATSYELRIPVSCTEGPGALAAQISWAKDVAPGTPLTVSVQQSYY